MKDARQLSGPTTGPDWFSSLHVAIKMAGGKNKLLSLGSKEINSRLTRAKFPGPSKELRLRKDTFRFLIRDLPFFYRIGGLTVE